MPQHNYYAMGDNQGICDQCGRCFLFSALRKRWDGAWVDDDCWEPRQPQDFVRVVRDNPSVPVARPSQMIFLSNAENVPGPAPLAWGYLAQYTLGGP